MNFENIRKVVLLNGPPRCGKDTIVQMFQKIVAKDAYQLRIGFADELKERAHALHKLYVRQGEWGSPDTWVLCDFKDADRVAPFDFFEKTKDTPMAEFRGRTPREAYIDLAEKLMRPTYGADIFTQLWFDAVVEKSKGMDNAIVYVPDNGFVPEVLPLIEKFGIDRLCHIQIYRPGTNFDKDSRKYVTFADHGIETKRLFNDSTLDALQARIEDLVEYDILGIRKNVAAAPMQR